MFYFKNYFARIPVTFLRFPLSVVPWFKEFKGNYARSYVILFVGLGKLRGLGWARNTEDVNANCGLRS